MVAPFLGNWAKARRPQCGWGRAGEGEFLGGWAKA